MNRIISIDEMPTSMSFSEFSKRLAKSSEETTEYSLRINATSWSDHSGKRCLSCGAKTDARGSLPCGH